MVIEFRDVDGRFIKQWPNAEDLCIPQKGDIVAIHWGDNNEETEMYEVVSRIISGTESNKLFLNVKKKSVPLTVEMLEALDLDPDKVAWFEEEEGFRVDVIDEKGKRSFSGIIHTTDELKQALILCNIKRYEL